MAWSTGLTVAMMTRGGSDMVRGTANYTHWNNKINSANLSQKVAFLQDPRQEDAFRQGRSHIAAFTLGGPLHIWPPPRGGPSVCEWAVMSSLIRPIPDRLEHRLSPEEEAAVIDATRELIADAVEAIRRHAKTELPAAGAPALSEPREPLRVLGYAVNGVADEVALTMLSHLLDGLPITMEITGTRMRAAELVSLVRDREFTVVCFADLPPSSSSKTRYLLRKLRLALPELRIAVGGALDDRSCHISLRSRAEHNHHLVCPAVVMDRNRLGIDALTVERR